MIEVQQLSRRYGEFTAVDDVSFSIPSGEVVGLLGHNGAGKTTIMKMLTGYLEPSAGVIRVNGNDVMTDPHQVQSDIGYLPENLPVYPEMCVADYLEFTATLRGCDPASVVPQALQATDLADRALDEIATLSRGLKQRVGVAQAILHKPSVLILDEPTNGLDPNQTQHMRNLIRELAQQATVVLSTHIMQEVNAICDRALILRNGELVLNETLANLQAGSGLKVRCDVNADLNEVLSAIVGVEITRLQTGHWHLNDPRSVDALAENVVGLLAQKSIAVYEVAPIQRDLESVFREVSEQEVVDAT